MTQDGIPSEPRIIRTMSGLHITWLGLLFILICWWGGITWSDWANASLMKIELCEMEKVPIISSDNRSNDFIWYNFVFFFFNILSRISFFEMNSAFYLKIILLIKNWFWSKKMKIVLFLLLLVPFVIEIYAENSYEYTKAKLEWGQHNFGIINGTRTAKIMLIDFDTFMESLIFYFLF